MLQVAPTLGQRKRCCYFFKGTEICVVDALVFVPFYEFGLLEVCFEKLTRSSLNLEHDEIVVELTI